MTDLLDEVREDLKEERHSYIVQKITRIFAVSAVLVIIGVSAYVWKERSANKLQSQLGIWFNQALVSTENNQPDEAISYFDKIIEHSYQQYAALAYFHKASLLFKQNKFTEGQKTLLEIAEHKHFDQAIRELAQIDYLGNQLNSDQPELDKTEEILIKLTKANKPWRLSGLQLKALYDIKHNKIAEAKASLNEILASKQATKSSYDTAASILAAISRTE